MWLHLVLAAYYRPYFVHGLEPPTPQSRAQTLKCMGHKTTTQLDRALRETMHAIWHEPGHSDELPDYLISQQLLTATDLELVPPHRMQPPSPEPGALNVLAGTDEAWVSLPTRLHGSAVHSLSGG